MVQKFWWPVVLMAGIFLSGCSSMDSSVGAKFKAPPSNGAGFVPMQQMANRPDLPFNKVWAKPGVNWKRYRTIYIAPVNSAYIMQANWWQQSIRAGQMRQDVANMASFMRSEFIRAFQNDPRHRFRVVMAPQRGSLTLELALTELVPSHVLLNAIKIGGPYGSGLGAAILERSTEAQSTVACEGRIRDTNTRQTLAMFADREYAVVRPIDLKGLTWYGNAEDIITTWAKQCVEIANRRPGAAVKPASNFSLKPW